MQSSITRKDFLSGFLKYFREEYRGGLETGETNLPGGGNGLLLPPGALSLENFTACCTQCFDCVSVCPHEALRVHRRPDSPLYGFPVIDPAEQPCWRCTDFPCTAACGEEALDLTRAAQPLGLAVIVENHCLAFNGHFCRSCISNCPEGSEAIYADSDGHPVVVEQACTGCGQCVFSCAAETPAIRIIPAAKQKE